jgi:hypothetical protein
VTSRRHPEGYEAAVTGAEVTSRPCAPTLTLRYRPGAETVTVRLAPTTTCR